MATSNPPSDRMRLDAKTLVTLVLGAVAGVASIGAAQYQLNELSDDSDALRQSHVLAERRLTLLEHQQRTQEQERASAKQELKQLRKDVAIMTRNIDALCIAANARCHEGH